MAIGANKIKAKATHFFARSSVPIKISIIATTGKM